MKTVSTTELKRKLADQRENFYLIDVRELEEYEAGHIPGALFMPWHIINEKVHGLKPERELIVYCSTSVRASKAAEILRQQKFTNIAVYQDGYSGWEKNL